MSWERFDDGFTDRPIWDGVSYEARWHYHALVGICCRQRRWDGLMPLPVARRASDVSDPDKCHAELERVGLVYVVADTVKLPHIDEHVPSPGVRANAVQAAVRMRAHRERSRLHAAGDHSRCLPGKCESRDSSNDVTKNVGTGRVGSGNPNYAPTEELQTDATDGVTVRCTECHKPTHFPIAGRCRTCHASWLRARRDSA
jgi:hypothetical protein